MAADLLLGLGAAVVKVACKIWLGDNSFASDAGTDVVDIVKDKLSGELDQRKARRLFEDLEVPVAKSKSPAAAQGRRPGCRHGPSGLTL
jgi:hypothetical protein